MTTEGTGVRLGDLLTGAGLLKAADLREAMLIAKQQGLPVGRVLIMSAYLTEHQLQAAVRAQSMLKDGLIDQETVTKALTLVGAEDLNLDDALKSLQWYQQDDVVTNKLGELMLEAGVVDITQLQQALSRCEVVGLPLGRVLVVSSVISEQMLAAALNAQILVRDKKITREQAIQGLRSSKERQIPIEQYLSENGLLQLPSTDSIRLGELLFQAGFVDEPGVMAAVEIGLIEEKPIGEVLKNKGLISDTLLQSSLDLQKLVFEGAIKKGDAPKALKLVKERSLSVPDAVKEIQPEPPPIPSPQAPSEQLMLYQFLQLAGLINPRDIETAVRLGSKDSDIMGRMLVNANILQGAVVSAAQKSNELLARGILNSEQAIMAVKTCHSADISLDEAFSRLNWDRSSLQLVASVGFGAQPVTAPPATPQNISEKAASSTAGMPAITGVEPATKPITPHVISAPSWGKSTTRQNLTASGSFPPIPVPGAEPAPAEEPLHTTAADSSGTNNPISQALDDLWSGTAAQPPVISKVTPRAAQSSTSLAAQSPPPAAAQPDAPTVAQAPPAVQTPAPAAEPPAPWEKAAAQPEAEEPPAPWEKAFGAAEETTSSAAPPASETWDHAGSSWEASAAPAAPVNEDPWSSNQGWAQQAAAEQSTSGSNWGVPDASEWESAAQMQEPAPQHPQQQPAVAAATGSSEQWSAVQSGTQMPAVNAPQTMEQQSQTIPPGAAHVGAFVENEPPAANNPWDAAQPEPASNNPWDAAPQESAPPAASNNPWDAAPEVAAAPPPVNNPWDAAPPAPTAPSAANNPWDSAPQEAASNNPWDSAPQEVPAPSASNNPWDSAPQETAASSASNWDTAGTSWETAGQAPAPSASNNPWDSAPQEAAPTASNNPWDSASQEAAAPPASNNPWDSAPQAQAPSASNNPWDSGPQEAQAPSASNNPWDSAPQEAQAPSASNNPWDSAPQAPAPAASNNPWDSAPQQAAPSASNNPWDSAPQEMAPPSAANNPWDSAPQQAAAPSAANNPWDSAPQQAAPAAAAAANNPWDAPPQPAAANNPWDTPAQQQQQPPAPAASNNPWDAPAEQPASNPWDQAPAPQPVASAAAAWSDPGAQAGSSNPWGAPQATPPAAPAQEVVQEAHEEPKEKPKKRLMDFMPKST